MQKFMEAICNAEDIILMPVARFEEFGGVALSLGQCKGIAYSDKLEDWQRLSVIAHELGHHAMGHHAKGHFECRKDRKTSTRDEREELEAQVFAATFTAMAMFMKYAKKLDIEEAFA